MTDHSARLARNAESKALAENDRMAWSRDDLAFLMEFFAEANGDAEEEAEVAFALGRTIEACRQRFYETRSGRQVGSRSIVRRTERTETTTVEYRGLMDDPDDQWWSPDYYSSKER